MLDLQPLAGLRERVEPPSYDALADTARRRDRRSAILTAAGSAVVVLTVAVGALLVTHADVDSSPAPVITPTPTPTPSPTPAPTHHSGTSMTPKEVVQADNAQLVMTAVSNDDPDFRVAVWQAECTWCPRDPESRFPHPSFTGMAITNDGFATATYRHTRVIEPEDGGLPPVYAMSPGPGLMLLVDDSNGGEWLVRDDGTITRQARVDDGTPTGDPRSWFVCLTNYDHLPWVNPGTPSTTWCRLDAERNTVHAMGAAWYGSDELGPDAVSMVSPASRAARWGISNKSFDNLDVWWESGGTRHTKDLGPARASGAIGNSPAGTMSFWSWSKGSPTITIFTSSDQGRTWKDTTLAAANRPIRPWDLDLSWSPEGALLARQGDAFTAADNSEGIRIWRSPSLDSGAFAMVYEGSSQNAAGGINEPLFTVVGSRIWSRGLWSDDDGVTWSAVPRWR